MTKQFISHKLIIMFHPDSEIFFQPPLFPLPSVDQSPSLYDRAQIIARNLQIRGLSVPLETIYTGLRASYLAARINHQLIPGMVESGYLNDQRKQQDHFTLPLPLPDTTSASVNKTPDGRNSHAPIPRNGRPWINRLLRSVPSLSDLS